MQILLWFKLHNKKSYFIAGIDPGLYTAIVLLSLNGNIKSFFVSKDLGEEKVVEFISMNGTASLVATDVSPPPKFVSKVSAMVNAPIFYPEKSLTKEEKELLGKNISNPHIRDAYSAARKAYNFFINRMRSIDKEFGIASDSVKHSLLRGRRIHDDAIVNNIKRRFKNRK